MTPKPVSQKLCWTANSQPWIDAVSLGAWAGGIEAGLLPRLSERRVHRTGIPRIDPAAGEYCRTAGENHALCAFHHQQFGRTAIGRAAVMA